MRMDLLLIPVTNVLDDVLNHATENVGSDCPITTTRKRYMGSFTLNVYFSSAIVSRDVCRYLVCIGLLQHHRN